MVCQPWARWRPCQLLPWGGPGRGRNLPKGAAGFTSRSHTFCCKHILITLAGSHRPAELLQYSTQSPTEYWRRALAAGEALTRSAGVPDLQSRSYTMLLACSRKPTTVASSQRRFELLQYCTLS